MLVGEHRLYSALYSALWDAWRALNRVKWSPLNIQTPRLPSAARHLELLWSCRLQGLLIYFSVHFGTDGKRKERKRKSTWTKTNPAWGNKARPQSPFGSLYSPVAHCSRVSSRKRSKRWNESLLLSMSESQPLQSHLLLLPVGINLPTSERMWGETATSLTLCALVSHYTTFWVKQWKQQSILKLLPQGAGWGPNPNPNPNPNLNPLLNPTKS